MNLNFYYNNILRSALLFGCFLIPVLLSAQLTVSGIITNTETNCSVADVSVYLNNTKIGTASNSSGEYMLNGIAPGVYEIIISHIGYEMLTKRIELKNVNVELHFKLTPRISELHNIVVMAKDMRQSWLTIFRQNFLGNSFPADKTKILNEDEIVFEKAKSPSGMTAFSEKPLIIENKELGYRIHFNLVEFYYDKLELRTYFKGYSRFEELAMDKEGIKKYEKNRVRYYLGSTQHFYQSLIADALDANDFVITIAAENLLTAPDRTDAGANAKKKNAGKKEISPTKDEIAFTAGNQPGKYFLYWKGLLTVKYKKNPYGKNRIQSLGFQDGVFGNGVTSGIELQVSPAVLWENGTLDNPLSVLYTGYWSHERIATLLPMDYKPQ